MRVQHLSILAATLMAFGAAPSVAQSKEPVAKAEAATRAKPEEKLICKRPRSTGTWTSEKVCRTKAEWKKFDSEQHGLQ